MQPVSFPGAQEIKKPADMTDEQCMSVWGTIVPVEMNGKTVNTFLTAWKPSYEDMQAFQRGEAVYVQTFLPFLPPMALFTLNEKGECNDGG